MSSPVDAGLRAADLEDGDLKAVKLGQTEVLLAKVDGEIHALGARCTHYGAPLEKGLLHGARLVCPWHHACFDVRSGALLEPPALDPLPRYPVRLEGEAVLVSPQPEPPAPLPKPALEGRTFAILGGGAAGEGCAEELGAQGFGGRVVMVTAEDRGPYDRTILSKDYLAGKKGPEKLPLRDDARLAALGVELVRGRRATGLDPASRTLTLEGGEILRYDALLLAPGSEPRRLEVPGAGLENVFTLRRPEDADRIAGAAGPGARAVVIGASFIGMEGAASLRARGLAVTVTAPEPVPFEKVLGPRVGGMFRALHEEKGVEFRLGAKVGRLEGNGKVEAVVLENGERLPADLVLVGVGVRPATGFVSGLELGEDGGVTVNAELKAAEGVWAAGDVARFPEPQSGEPVRVEHWRVALQHGRTAAANMLGRGEPYRGVPFFWTQQFGLSLRYVGHASSFDSVVFWGEPESREFVAYYAKGGRVLAAAGVGRDRDMDALEELMRARRTPELTAVRAGPFDLVAALRNG